MTTLSPPTFSDDQPSSSSSRTNRSSAFDRRRFQRNPTQKIEKPSSPEASSSSPVVANPLSTSPPTNVSDEEEDTTTDEEILGSDEDETDETTDEDELQERETVTFLNERSLENRTKEVITRVDLTLPRYGLLFWIQVLKVALMVTVILIAYLVGTGIAAIDNYLYLVLGSIATLLICGFDIIYMITYSMRNQNLAYDHTGTLWWSAIFTALAMLVSWFSLGRWCIVYATWGFDGSQPVPGNLVNYIRFVGSYAIMMVFPAVPLIIFTGRVFTAVMYPLTTIQPKKKKNR